MAQHFPYGDSPGWIDHKLQSMDLDLTITEGKSQKGSKSDTYLAKVTLRRGAKREATETFSNDNHRDVIIKLPKCPAGLQEISQKNRFARIAYMQTIEAHSSRKLTSLNGRVAKVLYSEVFSCTVNGIQTRLPTILQEYIPGSTLKAFLIDNHGDKLENCFGITDYITFYGYCRAIAELLQEVHRAQVVHGDISADNLMIKNQDGDSGSFKDRLCLIDFGEAIFLDEFGLGELGSLGILYDRLERVSEAYDIRQLGLLFAYMAGCDKDILEPRVRDIADSAQRAQIVADLIRRNNPILIRTAPGVAEAVSACLHPDADSRPRTAADVLSLLDIFVHTPPTTVDSTTILSEEKSNPRHTTGHATSHSYEILQGITQRTKARLSSQLADLNAGVQHVYGSRVEIEMGLCSIMGRLQLGDEYLTLSHPGFWSDINLGNRGPFFTMNRVALSRGATIRRIFIISEGDLNSPKRRMIAINLLKSHAELADEFRQRGEGSRSGIRARDGLPPYDVRILRVPEDHRRRLIIDGNNFGLLQVPARQPGADGTLGKEFITASLRYNGERIVGVTFAMKEDIGTEFRSRFDAFCRRSRVLDIKQIMDEQPNWLLSTSHSAMALHSTIISALSSSGALPPLCASDHGPASDAHTARHNF